MPSSPYSYTPPGNHLASDMWEPAQPRPAAASPTGDAAPKAPPRESLNPWGAALLRMPGVRLSFTAARYPHVVNQLAAMWNDGRSLQQYINGLLIDDRVDRAGFEFQALDELAGVRDLRLAELRTLGGGG
jgi:hypothetical protein